MTTAQVLDGAFTDEKGEKFFAAYDGLEELSRIYTGKPVSMLDKKEVWKDRDILFDFTVESGAETAQVLMEMAAADHIRGHHFKGID